MTLFVDRRPTMEDVYRGLQEVPETLAFAHVPKLQTQGMRWAPSTFLRSSSSVSTSNPNLGRLTLEGLLLHEKEFIELEDVSSWNSKSRKLMIEVEFGADTQHTIVAEAPYGAAHDAGRLDSAAVLVLEKPFSSIR